jgi:tetratricopeptide (TPR) repeat protein
MLFALLLAVFAASACTPRGEIATQDEATTALLGSVRALHHQADVFEHAGDLERAAEAVRRVLALPLQRALPEYEDVRADAYGRLAELALRRGAPDDALGLTDTGLAEAPRESVLRARLLMVRGQCLGALANRARERGDSAAEVRRREEAIAVLEQSIAMNQRILARALDGGAP